MQKPSAAAPTSTADPDTTEQTPVFTLEDFADVEGWEDVGLSEQDFEEYRSSKLGRPVPQQSIEDAELSRLGYKSWRHYVLEKYMEYWG
jgi:hypothetical protein